MITGARLAGRRQTRPISHLVGDRARFDTPPSMELIKRGRAICSYTPGQTARGIPAARWRRQYRKVGSRRSRNQRGGVPRGDDGLRRLRLGRNLHDLISLRLTPRAIPVTLSLSMRAPCGALITHDETVLFTRFTPPPSSVTLGTLFYAAQPTPAAQSSANSAGDGTLPSSAAPSALRTISLTPGTLCREICNLSI